MKVNQLPLQMGVAEEMTAQGERKIRPETIMDQTAPEPFQQAHALHRLASAVAIDMKAGPETGRKDMPPVTLPVYGATRFIRVCHLRSNKRLTNRLHRQRGTDAAAFDKIGERSRAERAVEEFRKSPGEALIRKQLVTARVKSDGLNLRTVLNRGARGLGKRSRRHGAAARAAPLPGPVFSHFKSNRRQIKNLPALTRLTIQGS
jgi:hypothetical protein